MEILKAHSLTKKYMRKTVLDNIDISLDQGKVYGLLGPNASGKTTLMKLIAGITQPTAGTLEVNGYPVGTETKRTVAYLPTVNPLPKWMTVGRCLSFYRDFFEDFNYKLAEERMELMGLKENQKLASLSTGMLGRLKIILAMSREAKIYLLDEPLNGLDPISRDKVLQMILASAGEENAILLATHIINKIEGIMDEVIFLNQGRVALAGAVETLRETRKMSMEELYKEVCGND